MMEFCMKVTGELFQAFAEISGDYNPIHLYEQTMKFVAPVFINDTITTKAKVLHIHEDKLIVTIGTVCENQKGETVIIGEAVLMMCQYRNVRGQTNTVCLREIRGNVL